MMEILNTVVAVLGVAMILLTKTQEIPPCQVFDFATEKQKRVKTKQSFKKAA